ncbi:MAG TPA: lipocalin family protein [Candidatus Nanoarchaeia archaeon]|nr:lipocalin family protein [Candidatus Nanoarchaeia archaeon]
MEYKKIKFPQDESAHDCIIEWWYFNGNLEDKKGNKYAFMHCFFKADSSRANIPLLTTPFKTVYFAHSLITDIKNQKFYQFVNPISIISLDSFSHPTLFINYANPSIKGYLNNSIENTNKNEYVLKTKELNLNFVSLKKPLLEGGKGFLELGSDSTYYYSLTNLKTNGRINVGGEWIELSGKSWMDHQWADVQYKSNKWSWFSIQLENDMDIVCFEYAAVKKKQYLASVSHKDSSQKHFTKVEMTPLDYTWTSDRTNAVYPLAWEIKIPEAKISLKIKSPVKNQEVNFGMINYWEGPIEIKAEINGKKTMGLGFMELVGYAANYTKIKFLKNTFEESIQKLRDIEMGI